MVSKIKDENALADEIARLMEQAGRRMRRAALKQTGDLSITPAQARVLKTLQHAGGPLRINQLAGQLEILPRSVTSVIDDLEDLSLVERSPDRRDRRAVLVHLSAKGRAVLTSLAGRSQVATANVIGTLNQKEQHTLLTLLRKLTLEPEDK